jgi:NAD/NADP transhydrogenase alpha subunit
LKKSGLLRQAPGFLTNAAANVAMALTVFIASSTPRSTNPQVKETLMAEPLSPAAQAILDAVREICPAPADEIAAAALRAAANQVVPEPSDIDKGSFSLAAIRNRCKVRDQLLAIAAELEGGND